MRPIVALLAALALLIPVTTHAQDGRAGIEAVAKAMGEPGLKSLEYNASGVLFQASNARDSYFSELALSEGRPQARFTDPAGKKVELTSPARLEPHTPAVIAVTSGGGAQQLRVNSRSVASGSASFAPAAFDQL